MGLGHHISVGVDLARPNHLILGALYRELGGCGPISWLRGIRSDAYLSVQGFLTGYRGRSYQRQFRNVVVGLMEQRSKLNNRTKMRFVRVISTLTVDAYVVLTPQWQWNDVHRSLPDRLRQLINDAYPEP